MGLHGQKEKNNDKKHGENKSDDNGNQRCPGLFLEFPHCELLNPFGVFDMRIRETDAVVANWEFRVDFNLFARSTGLAAATSDRNF